MSVPSGNLGASARSSLLWGGGFTLLRDLAQFGSMLILVRILSPSEYGIAALAQAFVGLASVISFGTFSSHALQMRNPSEIDWQAHFTAATVINSAVFVLTLAVAFLLSFTHTYQEAAWPLAGLAFLFIVEIPGTLRHRMLEVAHDWKRFRILLMIGTGVGLATGLVVGFLGGGVWALIVQPPLFGLPAAIDLFLAGRFRPNWSWSWSRYRDTVRFGLSRAGVGAVSRGRSLVEQSTIAGAFDLASLGVFSRAMGLATLIAGRIGSIAMLSLYPVITRAEKGSDNFRRIAGLVLRGVVWTTVPAANILAISAQDFVRFLYGERWVEVAPLLTLACTSVALGSIASALSGLLLANGSVRESSMLDSCAAVAGISIALWLVPNGASTYLFGVCLLGAAVVTISAVLLIHNRAMTSHALADAFVPALLASAAAMFAVVGIRRGMGANELLMVRLLADILMYALGYIAILRFLFPRALADLVEVLPGAVRLSGMLGLAASSHYNNSRR